MTAKQARNVFNAMIAGLAKQSGSADPKDADPNQLMVTIAMHTLQANWEIAAQLAEINAHLAKSKSSIVQ